MLRSNYFNRLMDEAIHKEYILFKINSLINTREIREASKLIKSEMEKAKEEMKSYAYQAGYYAAREEF